MNLGSWSLVDHELPDGTLVRAKQTHHDDDANGTVDPTTLDPLPE